MPTTTRRLNVSCVTASFATISWYWQATAYRCGTAWPTSRSAKRSLGRRRNGGHPAPRQFASAISRGKTIHGSLFSSYSPILTDARDDEGGQGSGKAGRRVLRRGSGQGARAIPWDRCLHESCSSNPPPPL